MMDGGEEDVIHRSQSPVRVQSFIGRKLDYQVEISRQTRRVTKYQQQQTISPSAALSGNAISSNRKRKA